MKIPFIAAVHDYNDFKKMVNFFIMADINLKYEEVGLIDNKYHAVFFKKKGRKAKNLIRNLNTAIDELV